MSVQRQEGRKRRRDAGVPRVQKEYPDEVIAVKLNRGNDDERKALEAWNEWLSLRDEMGRPYTKRQIFTWATLQAKGMDLPANQEVARMGLNEIVFRFQQQIDELNETIARLSEMGVSPSSVKKQRGKARSSVDTGYLQNLLQAFQGGDEQDE